MKDSLLMLIALLVVAVLVVQVIIAFEILSGHGSVTTAQSNLGYVTVSATGTASAQPQQATLYLYVQGKGKTGAGATANLSVALEQLNSSLYRYVNGNLSNMQTTYYSLNNQTYGYPCGPYPAGVAGSSNGSAAQGVVYPCGKYNATSMYVAQEQITATIPDIHNLSKVIGALSAVNGIHITNAAATLTGQQSSSLRKLAYASAMTNATSQAQALAGNATLSIQNITTSYYNFYPVPYALGASSAAGINSSIQVNPQFYSGSATVTESITVQFSYNR